VSMTSLSLIQFSLGLFQLLSELCSTALRHFCNISKLSAFKHFFSYVCEAFAKTSKAECRHITRMICGKLILQVASGFYCVRTSSSRSDKTDRLHRSHLVYAGLLYRTHLTHYQGRINHCAMAWGPRRRGPPAASQYFFAL